MPSKKKNRAARKVLLDYELFIGGVRAIVQNKPNSLNTRINATLFAAKLYKKIRPGQVRQNKPKRTQFHQRSTQYAPRNTPAPRGKNKPNLSRRSRIKANSPAMRGTQRDIQIVSLSSLPKWHKKLLPEGLKEGLESV